MKEGDQLLPCLQSPNILNTNRYSRQALITGFIYHIRRQQHSAELTLEDKKPLIPKLHMES